MMNHTIASLISGTVACLLITSALVAGLTASLLTAEAGDLCSRPPEGRHFAEAEQLRGEDFSKNVSGDSANQLGAYSRDQRKKYEAWIIGCNRKNDNKARQIEEGFRASDSFHEDIPPRTVKGHLAYQSLKLLEQRYAYQIERDAGKWIITVPVKFEWPGENVTDMLDIPTALAKKLGLMKPGGVCQKGNTVFRDGKPNRVEKGFIAYEFTPEQLNYIHSLQKQKSGDGEDLRASEPINSRYDYENLDSKASSQSIFLENVWDIAYSSQGTSCRVSRKLMLDNPSTIEDDTMSILGHLRSFWKMKLPSYWNLPNRNGNAFEVQIRMIGCEGDRSKYGCDFATSGELNAWKKDKTIWNIRFNLRPRSRAKFKSNPSSLNNMYVGSSMWVVAHEMGHQLGLDDEYAWQGGDRCESSLSGEAGERYLMCDQDAKRSGMQGVYPWIVTRRITIAKKLQCKKDLDCGEEQYCAKNGLNRNTCERKKVNGKACWRKEVCRSGRCNLATCKAPNECSKDYQCGANSNGIVMYCNKTGVNDCRPRKENDVGCSRDGQCQSGRCYWGKCKPLDACKNDWQCPEDQYCDKGTLSFGVNLCKPDRDRGKGCSRKEQCKSNRCSWGFCAKPK